MNLTSGPFACFDSREEAEHAIEVFPAEFPSGFCYEVTEAAGHRSLPTRYAIKAFAKSGEFVGYVRKPSPEWFPGTEGTHFAGLPLKAR